MPIIVASNNLLNSKVSAADSSSFVLGFPTIECSVSEERRASKKDPIHPTTPTRIRAARTARAAKEGMIKKTDVRAAQAARATSVEAGTTI